MLSTVLGYTRLSIDCGMEMIVYIYGQFSPLRFGSQTFTSEYLCYDPGFKQHE